MKVLGLHWLGMPSERYPEMVRLLRDVMRLPINFEEPTTVEFSLPSGDELQVFAPGDRYYEFFRARTPGPVPLFEVDDVLSARAELEAAGSKSSAPSRATAAGNGRSSARPTGTCTRSRAACEGPGPRS
jgi:hypothetical protein